MENFVKVVDFFINCVYNKNIKGVVAHVFVGNSQHAWEKSLAVLN